MDLFLHPDVTDDYTLAWGHPDIAGIKRMLCGDYDFSEERVEKAMENFCAKAGQKTLEAGFNHMSLADVIHASSGSYQFFINCSLEFWLQLHRSSGVLP